MTHSPDVRHGLCPASLVRDGSVTSAVWFETSPSRQSTSRWWSSLLGALWLCLGMATSELSAQDPAAPAAEAAPEVKAEDAPVDPDANYAPSRLSPDDETKWRRSSLVSFQNALRSSAPTTAETKVLVDGATLYVNKITMTSLRKDLWKSAVDPAKRVVDLAPPAIRSILASTMVKQIGELLKENPRHPPEVELNLVLLLANLNSQPGSTTPPTPMVPYTPAHPLLIEYVQDPTRLVQSRIHAAMALGRIGRDAVVGVKDGDLSVVQRAAVATSVATTLRSTEIQGPKVGHVWLRWRLVEALGNCGLGIEPTGAPSYIDAAMAVAADPKENIKVRAAALQAVSQMNLPGNTNVPLILSEIMKVVEQVAKNYNAAAQAKAKLPVDPDSSWAIMECYLAFQPATQQQANAPRLWGMLNQSKRSGLGGYSASIKGAYDLCVPITNHMINNAKSPIVIPKAQVDAVSKWIQDNPPADRKPTATSAALP